MTSVRGHAPVDLRRIGRNVGHGVTLIVDLLLLWIVDNLLAWDVLPFLTGEFAEVSGLIMFSLVASMVVHVALLASSRPRPSPIERAALAAIDVWVSISVLRVFPFDFDEYSFDWSIVARTVLVIGVIGSAIGLLTALARLARLDDR